jgi:PAS domain S-box-containing protein
MVELVLRERNSHLIFTPLLLYLAQDWRKIAAAKAARHAEALMLFLTLPFAARIAYTKGIGGPGLIDPLGYIPYPLLMWAAIRFGPAGASCALSIVSVLLVAAALGPAAVSRLGAIDSILSVQLYIFVIAIPIMALAVLIEQQRSTEESFRESERRFRIMADTAPVMIWMSGRDKLCSFFNASWLAFTGRSMEQELGDGWAKGVHPEDLNRCLQTYSSSFDARQKFQMEYRLRRADGEYRWLLDDGIPLFEPGGLFAGYIGSCTDITELRRAQQETLARQKLESVGVLAGGIAHDFNNLLGGILVEAELAQAELSEGAVPLDGIQRIVAVARRGAEIVRELMMYAGQDKADPVELVDLSSLVKEMVELLRVSISKHAALRTDLQDDLPAVVGRASQIRQILMNLIINASEALGSDRGVITITTSHFVIPRDSDPKKAPQLPEGTYVDLSVSDTGCGMSEEARAKIFDPFFSTKFAGRGLGLAVVQGIVRDHGGAIHLVSSPGTGTTFEIFLPCSSETPQNYGDTARSYGQEQCSSGTVLVVEDEGFLRSAVAKMLRKNGFGVIEATDGSAALEQVRSHKNAIDVMLLDVTLPGMSSRDVFARAQDLCPNLKVIFTSAYSRETVDGFVAGVSVDRFIRKPFQLADLMAVVRNALSS